jgi:Asp-tRNAAsn/Glu-tRNAGln amidotransferase A subunit and related amidases
MNLKNITADRLVSLYANRDLSVTEVITSVFDEIDRSDGNIHAFITLCRERALEEARRTDSRIAAEEPLSELTGVPVAIKDNMNLRDVPTTCGRKCWRTTSRPTRQRRGTPAKRRRHHYRQDQHG